MIKKSLKNSLIFISITFIYLITIILLQDSVSQPFLKYMVKFISAATSSLFTDRHILNILHSFSIMFFLATFISLRSFSYQMKIFEPKKNKIKILKAIIAVNYFKPEYSKFYRACLLFSFIILPFLVLILVQFSLFFIAFYLGLHFSNTVASELRYLFTNS